MSWPWLSAPVAVEVRVPWLVGLVVRPVHWAVVAPRVALDVAGAAWVTARAVPGVVATAAEVLSTLAGVTQRVDQVLDVLELPGRRVAAELDGELVDDLLHAARAAPELVVSMQEAIASFEGFLARAEEVRAVAQDVTGLSGALTAQVAAVLGVVDRLLEQVHGTVTSAEATAVRVDGVVGDARVILHDAAVLLGRVDTVLDVTDTVAGRAQDVAVAAEDLVRQARPVVEVSVELGALATGPARTLVEAAVSSVPAFAELVPDLVAALEGLAVRLPDMFQSLDADVLPTLRELRGTPADVRRLRDSVTGIETQLNAVEAELAGLPGAKLLRRRGRRA